MLSRDRCYYPDCPAHIIVFVESEPFIDYHIAHIRDANPGNRYDSAMSNDERRAFSNLILLCKPHHDLVDKRHPERFSIEDLTSWKRAREGSAAQSLSDLQAITEDDLEPALVQAAKVEITGSIIHLGGHGGAAPGAGGGGGAGIGGGFGGTGGPGGDTINLDGTPAKAPGAGGGAGGATGRGAIGGDGGGGGQRASRVIQVEEGDQLDIQVGEAGTPTRDAGVSAVHLIRKNGIRELVAEAAGGIPGRSGIAKQDERLGPAVIITSALFADSIHIRDGLLFILGGGWDHCTPAMMPGRLTVPFVAVAEPIAQELRTTELLLEVRDDHDVVRQSVRHQLALPSSPTPCRLPVAFCVDVEVSAPGTWRVAVTSGGVELTSVPLRVDAPVAQTPATTDGEV